MGQSRIDGQVVDLASTIASDELRVVDHEIRTFVNGQYPTSYRMQRSGGQGPGQVMTLSGIVGS